ncbi:MAG: DNA repair protein RecO [Deltaproteobacteria bacterium RIFCSPHIGHO2_02_FULL_42_44]|nr:MAG: DNA repair protein RecO [Deltaproteobacteria bacterium RIFCSPHIGHO2_02_FULL_42_44]
MTGHFKTEAIVLKSMDYGESDRIITFYTLEFGKVKGIAKGARNSKKRFVNNLEPFSYINLLFFQKQGRDLVIVEQAEVIRRFDTLTADLERFAFACYCLELLNEMTLEEQKNIKVFELLVKFLIMLNGGAGIKTIVMFFQIKLFSLLGYYPHLDTCIVCKNIPTDDNKVFFSTARSGILCFVCGDQEKSLIPVSQGTVKFLILAARIDIEKAERIDMAEWAAKECEKVIGDFIIHHLGKELKSKKFIEKIDTDNFK